MTEKHGRDVRGLLTAGIDDLVQGLSLELVDVSIARRGGTVLVEVSIDKDGGVTVEDCAEASRLIKAVIERDGLVEGRFVLDVMSPGVDRPLRNPGDFADSLGKRIKVRLSRPYEGRSSFSGILVAVGDEGFTLDAGEELIELRYAALSRARLDPELPW